MSEHTLPRRVHIDTPAFTGPFDLLLQLITRHQVDIYEVPLATIVDDYLAEMSRLDELDLELATGFLLIAATLIELKTVALLPDPDDVDLDEELALYEERDLLITRLLQAQTFKDASRVLERRLDESAGFHARDVGLEERFLHLCPDLLHQVVADDLRRLAEGALADRPLPVVDVSHITVVRASVREAMALVVQRLPGAGRLSLRRLSAGARSRLEVVVVFLALLELYKQGLVELHQAVTFGDLSADWVGEAGLGLPDWSGATAWDDTVAEGEADDT
jgi:segregation and condensation protein A